MHPCINCGNAEVPEHRDYCFNCSDGIRGEIEQGLKDLADYMARHAAFGEWCQTHRR